jgi:hypothetical protein
MSWRSKGWRPDLSIMDLDERAWFEKKRAIIREHDAWSPHLSYFVSFYSTLWPLCILISYYLYALCD